MIAALSSWAHVLNFVRIDHVYSFVNDSHLFGAKMNKLMIQNTQSVFKEKQILILKTAVEVSVVARSAKKGDAECAKDAEVR